MVEYPSKRIEGVEAPCPCVIIGADCPGAVAALIAYADASARLGADAAEVESARAKAVEFDRWRNDHLAKPSDPTSAVVVTDADGHHD